MIDQERFPLSTFDRPKVESVIQLIRTRLNFMAPADLRAAASALVALERLPRVTPGIQISFGFKEPTNGGNYGWVDIKISENEFILAIGEHFYDPEIGGDTETRNAFEAYAGDASSRGSIDDWLETTRPIAAKGLIAAEDYSDHDSVDWFLENESSWDGVVLGDDHSSQVNPSHGDDCGSEHEHLRRIFEDASGPMKEPIRDQLAYRHMVALADNFEGWALYPETTPEQSAKLLGLSESLRRLSDEVGPDWDPPPPDHLTLLGFLGRKAVGE